jgi:hypothetical protein
VELADLGAIRREPCAAIVNFRQRRNESRLLETLSDAGAPHARLIGVPGEASGLGHGGEPSDQVLVIRQVPAPYPELPPVSGDTDAGI